MGWDVSWKDVGNVVGKAAPWVGSLLGGKAGEAVGNLVAEVLGTESSPQAVSAELAKNPEAFLKLKEMEINQKNKLAELASEEYREELRTSAQTVTAEIQGESWLQRNWRPILMLWFAFLVGIHWFGWTPKGMNESEVLAVFEIIKIGVGGYIVGRSVEKGLKIYKK